MLTLKKIVASLFLLLFTYFGFSQSYFSKRLNVGGKLNSTLTFRFHNDTFLIPASVIEVNYNVISASILKVDKTGNIILQKRAPIFIMIRSPM